MKQERAGEISMLSSCIFFSLMAILVKLSAPAFSGLFISLFRFIMGIIIGGLLLFFTKQSFSIVNKKLWFLRGGLGSFAMVVYYVAIQSTSSGRATLLMNIFPIFVAFFGYVIFQEAINLSALLSIILCVIGIILIFYDGSAYTVWGNLLGLVPGIIRGLTVHLIKRSAEKNNPIIVYLAVCFFGLLLLPISGYEVTKLTWPFFFLLFGVAIFAFTAQVLMTYGYRHTAAIKGSIISYMTIPLTIFFSSVFLKEEFKSKFFLGLVFVVAGLIVNAFSERLKREDK